MERKALACYWGILHFKFYLWGLTFVVRTDHKPLAYMFSVKGSSSSTQRIANWRLGLEVYNFRVEYVQDSKNLVADYLS